MHDLGALSSRNVLRFLNPRFTSSTGQRLQRGDIFPFLDLFSRNCILLPSLVIRQTSHFYLILVHGDDIQFNVSHLFLDLLCNLYHRLFRNLSKLEPETST